jgi:serine/threonine protein kinase/tetratricopeptide (TPR) repeat protein
MSPNAPFESPEDERRRTCPACGAPYVVQDYDPGCPVCLLRQAMQGEPTEQYEATVQDDTADDARFDHYKLMRRADGSFDELGRGAIGVTYRALDTVLHCTVALKALSVQVAANPTLRERFRREARAAAQLRHPNVASVFYYGVRKHDKQCFYAMELVGGETLDARIRRTGPVPVSEALEIVMQVTRALAAAETQGLVHRDLKPANLMLTYGPELIVKVIDFGLVKVEVTDECELTHGGFVGTPAFASPEQFTGARVDSRSDLYSLGVTLWVMLTGKPPFRGSNTEVIRQHLHAPLPLHQIKTAPQPLIVLLEMLLHKDPARRFQNPTNLLKVIPAVMRAVKARRTIKHQGLRTVSVQEPSSGPQKLPAIRVPKRSIAVLPFETLGHGKTYFADGIQDEILSNIAKVSQLKVISRTSVMAFRPGDHRNLRSIAASLGVANVVEGTVRRDGNRVRITIRLVDARTDKTLWSEIYNRSLTDIFAIQSDIAQKVAARLTAQLSPKEKKELEETRTKDVEAYDLYLRAKEMIFVQDLDVQFEPTDERERLLSAIRLLEEATKKDSQFALAFCQIAKANDALYWSKIDQTPRRRALADLASNEALRLRPDLAEVRVSAAWHHFVYRDDERALEELAGVRRSLANSAEALLLKAFIARRQGRWEEAVTGMRRALSLDVRNQVILGALFDSDYWLRRYREVEQIFDRLIELAPDKHSLKAYKASVAFEEKADLAGYRTLMEKLPSSSRNNLWNTSLRFQNAVLAREWRDAKRILRDSPYSELYFSFYPYSWANSLVPCGCHEIWLAALQRGSPTMEARFESARDELKQKTEAQPDDAGLISVLGLLDAALGRKQEAIQEARRATEMLPISKDAVEGPPLVSKLALVYAWTNEPDLAFQELAISVKTPAGIHYGELTLDPAWDPIRKDPRFEKLLGQLAPNQSLQKTPSSASRAGARRPTARQGPKKISVARLPVTGSDLFGREEDIAFLDNAWANQDVNVVTIVAWAGVGKSTLINHWLRRMAADHYRSAELIFGWSFYRQGTSGDTSSADDFLDAALSWFGDPDPRLGTAWEKGERLARLVVQRRTLLILDGLEPLQNPPGPEEGRLRDPALQALLRELAAFNKGLCVITTRTPVADIADHERTSAFRRDLEQLSSDAGAKLLRAMGVKGHEAELRSASEEFRGHCLALTLLGSYLTDAFNGDIRFRKEISDRLAHDLRQGAHAQKVMESYQTWFGEGPELSVLRILGLFDRPADEKAIAALLQTPVIPGLTESLTDLSQVEWRKILARLRRARLLAAEDPNNPGQLDSHPLVREYFGDQLRTQRTGAWKESNRRLYKYYQSLAPELPETFREMEPLFLAVIHGCNADLFREALREVYIPRIQRENSYFAANILGARRTLLSVLGQFFENGWELAVIKGAEEHSLSEEDELFILLQAGQYLTATRGFGAPGVRACYERAESLCHTLNRPHSLYVSLMGQWRHLCATERGTTRLQLAQRIYSLARKQNEVAQLIGAFSALATTNYGLGDFEASHQYAIRGVELWRSGGLQSTIEEVDAPGIACLCCVALFQLHNSDITSSQATIEEAISLARELNDMHGLAVALDIAASAACDKRDLMKVELYSSELIELSTRYHFALWMAAGVIYRGWALSAAGKSAEGILSIEQGIRDLRATGELNPAGDYLALKAEALYLADRSYEALETIKEAELLAERFESRAFDALFLRLHGVFLTAIGAEESQIESSFCEAIRVAKEQKSILLAKRAEATYAEYRRQKASAAGGRGFRLPL